MIQIECVAQRTLIAVSAVAFKAIVLSLAGCMS
jgi:hypothetical protein